MEPTESRFVATSRTPEHEPSSSERFSHDLNKINAVIIELLQDSNANEADVREAWMMREILTERYIDAVDPTADNPTTRSRLQFDMIVDKAILFETVGNTVRYLEELDTAEAFALNSNLTEVVASIGEELDTKIPELGASHSEIILKLRDIIVFSNREYLRDLVAKHADADDFFGAVYGMILEEGSDPDEVLTRLGVIE